MMKELLERVLIGKNLTQMESYEVMDLIMKGGATPAQIGSLLTALRMKGETVNEITGFARGMRNNLTPVKTSIPHIVDTCGTGGDLTGTFNISTISAIIAASGGVHVAKHGNRAVSSTSGSADVLEALGVNIGLSASENAACLEQIGLCFMFAPDYHEAMKHAVGPRKELGFRTVFNLLGPLTNPANASRQVLGVYSRSLVEPIANVLRELGCERALVVAGHDGMDELTITTASTVAELRDGEIHVNEFDPKPLLLNCYNIQDIRGGTARENAEMILAILNGNPGAPREIALLNAAATLYVAEKVASIQEGMDFAAHLIDSGASMRTLQELRSFTGGVQHAS